MSARALALLALLASPATGQAQEPRAAIEPLFGATRDSDGNLGLRVGLGVDAIVGPGSIVGLEASRWQVEDGLDRIRTYQAAARTAFRAGRSVRLEAVVGAAVVDLSGVAATEVTPVTRLRFRWGGPRGSAVELRAAHAALDVSPDLLANRVIRTEGGATVDLPLVAGFKLRGIGRVARLGDRLDRNTRTAATGMLVFQAGPAVELSGQFHAAHFDHFSTAGYFAPRLVQSAQLGSYGEIEGERVMFAYDVAAGAQRVANHGVALGPWGRALSLWSMLGISVTRVTVLKLELEFYDSPAAGLAAGPGWIYGAGRVSLRQSF